MWWLVLIPVGFFIFDLNNVVYLYSWWWRGDIVRREEWRRAAAEAEEMMLLPGERRQAVNNRRWRSTGLLHLFTLCNQGYRVHSGELRRTRQNRTSELLWSLPNELIVKIAGHLVQSFDERYYRRVLVQEFYNGRIWVPSMGEEIVRDDRELPELSSETHIWEWAGGDTLPPPRDEPRGMTDMENSDSDDSWP
jgi:hypothetical protein|tara:strand:+ start:52 stop:630 length:579 start_codon:yes stop_codon:yes gene_type:complete